MNITSRYMVWSHISLNNLLVNTFEKRESGLSHGYIKTINVHLLSQQGGTVIHAWIQCSSSIPLYSYIDKNSHYIVKSRRCITHLGHQTRCYVGSNNQLWNPGIPHYGGARLIPKCCAWMRTPATSPDILCWHSASAYGQLCAQYFQSRPLPR